MFQRKHEEDRIEKERAELNSLIEGLYGSEDSVIPGGEGRLNELLGGREGGVQGPDQKAVHRIQELNPALANEVLGTISSGDEGALGNLRDLSESGVKFGDSILSAPTIEEKRKLVVQHGLDSAAKGSSPERAAQMLNMNEDELNLEARRLQVIGKDVNALLKPKPFLDTPQGQEAFAKIAARNPAVANQILNLYKTRAEVKGVSGRGSFSKSPGVVVKTGDETYAQSIPVMNQQTGQMENVLVPIEGQPVSRLGETGLELSQRRANEAGERSEATTREKGQQDRIQLAINSGLEAADAAPIVRRSMELLDSVKTGGLHNASRGVKQFFGVEGADEAELSANLGKTVLSQLRSTFGAAFTEREGARLADIEAGFGKSPEGNRRLLAQTLKIIERSANRGIKLAEQNGDSLSADEIREALDFTLQRNSETERSAPASMGRFTVELVN